MDLNSLGQKGIRVALASTLLAACTMDNPAFGETGESGEAETTANSDSAADGASGSQGSQGGDGDGAGSVDASSGGDGDDNASSSVSTDGGDGDGADTIDTGDGDTADSADTGDGDTADTTDTTDTGDGDTGTPVCEDVIIPVVADTFVTNGPQEGDVVCLTGWQAQGPAGVPCDNLNFGGSGELWLGEEGNGAEGHSLYLARFNVDALPDPSQFSFIESAQIRFTVYALETMPEGTEVWFELMTPGDAGYWVEGELDGTAPGDADQVTTYKYQYYATQPWPNNTPLPPVAAELGSVDVSGSLAQQSHHLVLEVPTVMAWFSNDIVGAIGNGVIVGSNAPLFDMLLPTTENQEGMPAMQLELSVCN